MGVLLKVAPVVEMGVVQYLTSIEKGSSRHARILQKMRSGALAAKLMVKTEIINNQKLIEKWTAELKSKWPCCILFLSE